MAYPKPIPPVCHIHGAPRYRSTCASCNAAYMRQYLRRRRLEAPARALWDRAKKRATRFGIPFSLNPNQIVIPRSCPALSIPLVIGERRSKNSPSLDRVRPAEGYVPGNVRVLSDYANRLKGNLALPELQERAASGAPSRRADYAKVAAYVDREALLAEVRAKAARGGRMGKEWEKIATFLERRFREGLH